MEEKLFHAEAEVESLQREVDQMVEYSPELYQKLERRSMGLKGFINGGQELLDRLNH